MLLSLSIYLLAAILTILHVVVPVRRYYELKAAREFHNEFKYFKLKRIKAHYESLRDLSYREIEEGFDIDAVYDKIR